MAHNEQVKKPSKSSCIKFGSAALYGAICFNITIVNKTVLTTYKFPSFLTLACGQLMSTIIVLFLAKKLKFIQFPDYRASTFATIFPLPLLHMGNTAFGLGATQAVNLPMFSPLRRLCVLFTMLFELKMLGIKPTLPTQMSVLVMVGAAFLAAFDDLTFNLVGYTYIMLANVFTAANCVYVKQKLDGSNMEKYGLIFYNSLFVFVPTVILTFLVGDVPKVLDFKGWNNPIFVLLFTLSCIMGCMVTFASFMCTQYNSALTTTVVGGFKGVFMPFVGIFVGGDYIFSWPNFIGINISGMAWLVYIYITFRTNQLKQAKTAKQVTVVGPCPEKVINVP